MRAQDRLSRIEVGVQTPAILSYEEFQGPAEEVGIEVRIGYN